MKAAHKILTAIAALALGGGSLALVREPRRPIAAAPARSSPATLPTIALRPEDARQLSKLEVTRPDDDDNTRSLVVTIERRGEGWEMTAPLLGEASHAAVAEAIRNLETLYIWKEIDSGTQYYERYDLTDGKALRITAWHGSAKVVDLICGKGSVDGQLVRLPDRDGMFALINWGPQGYQGFLFTRDVRSWRETSIFTFRPEDATRIEIANPHGNFLFAKQDGKWVASRHTARGAVPWPRFDPQSVQNLLRDYQSLAADDFGDRASRGASGVDDAERTGGVIRIRLRGGGDLTLRVGKPANDTSRFAVKDSRWAMKDGGDGTLYALSPYTAGWATAEARQFE